MWAPFCGGWLCTPRVSGCAGPMCFVELAVWAVWVLCVFMGAAPFCGGRLCAPRVSGCASPVCFAGLAVWAVCALCVYVGGAVRASCVVWGCMCGPRVSCGAGCADPIKIRSRQPSRSPLRLSILLLLCLALHLAPCMFGAVCPAGRAVWTPFLGGRLFAPCVCVCAGPACPLAPPPPTHSRQPTFQYAPDYHGPIQHGWSPLKAK